MRNLFIILIVLCLVSACAGKRKLAPVSDRGAPPSTKVQYHVVAAGETLYSIAWRYNQDYKKLRKINNIGGDYRIYPGQKISLSSANQSANTSQKPTKKPDAITEKSSSL